MVALSRSSPQAAPFTGNRISRPVLLPLLASIRLPSMNNTAVPTGHVAQCKKPRGWVGRFVLWNMNSRHSRVTDWGLAKVSMEKHFIVLDVGCGGGRTLSKLAAAAREGKVYGVDYSEESVAASKRTNARSLELGRVEVRLGSVSELPFPDSMFDLITAVETHFWWPDLPGDLREVFRVLKPGCTFLIIAEVYKGANTAMARLCEQTAPRAGMTLLNPDQHREVLTNAGFSDVQVTVDADKGWICAIGRK